MDLERYEFEVKEDRYEFVSLGPRGAIKKAVVYQKVRGARRPLYNLSFGDWSEQWNKIDDLSITNNGDRQKILTTVAATVVHFMHGKPEAFVLAMGRTPSRTRLYQMGIASCLTMIRSLFQVEGLAGNNWEPFQTGCNYSAFLLKPKETLNL